MLTGPEILKRMATGQIVITPKPEKVNPNSVNLRLGSQIKVYKKAYFLHQAFACAWEHQNRPRPDDPPDLENSPGLKFNTTWTPEPLDCKVKEETVDILIPEEGLVLWPGVLYLGRTFEHTETKDLVPCIEGRSSLARLGLCVHLTAGFGDVNFRGTWTLEMTVVHPLRVYALMEICQIAYSDVTGEIQLYEGKYQDQVDPTPSGLWKETGK